MKAAAQVEAIRGFQRRKGLTFAQAAITLGLVRRESLLLALSKHYNYPVLGFGSANVSVCSPFCSVAARRSTDCRIQPL